MNVTRKPATYVVELTEEDVILLEAIMIAARDSGRLKDEVSPICLERANLLAVALQCIAGQMRRAASNVAEEMCA